MFEFRSPSTDPVRIAVEQLRPLLSSTRLVRLFLSIGMLAVTRPHAVRTIEIAVEALSRPRRPAAASLSEQDNSALNQSTRRGRQA